MTREEFNKFCRNLPATTHVVQWRGCDVWKVGDKMFAIGSHSDGKDGFTFKTSDQNYQLLSDISGYRPAPYLASRGMSWIQQFGAPGSEDDELRYYLAESHRIVATGLSKKKQKALGLNHAD